MSAYEEFLALFPGVMREYGEFTVLARAESEELSVLRGKLAAWRANMFPAYADGDGLLRYEEMLGIGAGNDPVAVRRLRVLAKMNGGLPYTIKSLVRRLEQLCGGVETVSDFGGYAVGVRITDPEGGILSDIRGILWDMLPANIMAHITAVHTARFSQSPRLGRTVLTLPGIFRYSQNEVVRLSGGRSLDGGWFLNQTPQGISFPSFGAACSVRNRSYAG